MMRRGPTSSLAVRKGYSITRLAQTLWTRLSHSSTANTRRAMGNGNGGEQVSETKSPIFGHQNTPRVTASRAGSRRLRMFACSGSSVTALGSRLSPRNSDHRNQRFSRFQPSRTQQAGTAGTTFLVALLAIKRPVSNCVSRTYAYWPSGNGAPRTGLCYALKLKILNETLRN